MRRHGSLLALLLAGISSVAAIGYHRARLAERLGPQSVSDSVMQALAADGDDLGRDVGFHLVIVFTDFQCQFCRILHARLDTVRQKLPHPVRVVYRYFPLLSNPRAFALSLGAVCAARQGRLLAFADVVFPKQDSLGRYELSEFARISGIRDTLEFNRCVGSTLPRDRIASDVREAARLRILGTPLALIDGRVFRGVMPLDTLKAVLSVADRPIR